jgi:hypothetical protein
MIIKQRENCMKWHMTICPETPKASVDTLLCFVGLLGCDTVLIYFRGSKIEAAVIYLQANVSVKHSLIVYKIKQHV